MSSIQWGRDEFFNNSVGSNDILMEKDLDHWVTLYIKKQKQFNMIINVNMSGENSKALEENVGNTFMILGYVEVS